MSDRKDGRRGYAILSNMENNVLTIKDLARLLTMAASNSSIEEEEAGAIQRLGWVIMEFADYVEADRLEACEALAGYRPLLGGGATS